MADTSKRSVTEVISKTVALHIGVMIAYGHLQSLQGRRVEKSSVIRVCLFPFLPVLPMIELFLNALRTVIRYRKKRVGAWYLYMLDVGTDITNAAPDTRANPREGNGWANCATLGRVITILVCLTQSALTILLYIRRDCFGKDIHPFEYKNFHIAAAGVLSCLLSIPLLFLRNTPIKQHGIGEITLRVCLSMVIQPFTMFIFCRAHALEPFRFLFLKETVYTMLAGACFMLLLYIFIEASESSVTWKSMLETVVSIAIVAPICLLSLFLVLFGVGYPFYPGVAASVIGAAKGHGWVYEWPVVGGALENHVQFQTWKWKDPMAEILWAF